jgi:hypothetical protein
MLYTIKKRSELFSRQYPVTYLFRWLESYFSLPYFFCISLMVSGGLVCADPQDNTYALEELKLCADGTSVQVYADDAVLSVIPNLDQAIYGQFMKQLKNVLPNSSVPIQFQDSCEGLPGYTLLNVYIYYLDPEVYPEYKDDAFSYAMYVQVGEYASKIEMESQYTLPITQFLSFFEGVYASSNATSLQTQLSNQEVTMLLELAKAWWDDNPPPPSYLPHILGTLLALGIASAIYLRYRNLK